MLKCTVATQQKNEKNMNGLKSIQRLAGLVVLMTVVGTGSPSQAQLEPDAHPLDTFLGNILNFKEPTAVRGILFYIDKEEQVIWIRWQQRSADRPLFRMGWQAVPGDATLALHPKDSSQFEELLQLPKGTAIECIIQAAEEGKRRIHSYQLATNPEVPL